MARPAEEADEPEVVRLRVPADPAFAKLTRQAGSGLAARIGFDYDAAEEIRLAIAEAWTVLLGPAAHDITLEVTFHVGRDELGVELVAGGSAELPPPDPTARGVLEQIVDRLVLTAEGRGLRFSRRV